MRAGRMKAIYWTLQSSLLRGRPHTFRAMVTRARSTPFAKQISPLHRTFRTYFPVRSSICRDVNGSASAAELQLPESIRRSGVVELNVGGITFTTTWETLQGAPALVRHVDYCSAIGRMKDGIPFIDRDPTYFPLILNYLRGVEVALPSGRQQLKELYCEAEFYDLQEFMSSIRHSSLATYLLGNRGIQQVASSLGLVRHFNPLAVTGFILSWGRRIFATAAAIGASTLAIVGVQSGKDGDGEAGEEVQSAGQGDGEGSRGKLRQPRAEKRGYMQRLGEGIDHLLRKLAIDQDDNDEDEDDDDDDEEDDDEEEEFSHVLVSQS